MKTPSQPDLARLLHESRRLQGQFTGRVIAPLDAFFDLFAANASVMREQAAALEQAGRALEQSAALMKQQAELFEHAVKVVRQPADVARQIGGAPARHQAG